MSVSLINRIASDFMGKQKTASNPMPSVEEAPVVKVKGALPPGCEVRLYRKSGPVVTYLVGKNGQAVGLIKAQKKTRTDAFPYLASLIGNPTPIGAFWAPTDWEFIRQEEAKGGPGPSYPSFKGGLYEAARLICSKSKGAMLTGNCKAASDPKTEITKVMQEIVNLAQNKMGKEAWKEVLSAGDSGMTPLKKLCNNLVWATTDLCSDRGHGLGPNDNGNFKRRWVPFLGGAPRTEVSTEAAEWFVDLRDAIQYTMLRRILMLEAKALGIDLDRKHTVY